MDRLTRNFAVIGLIASLLAAAAMFLHARRTEHEHLLEIAEARSLTIAQALDNTLRHTLVVPQLQSARGVDPARLQNYTDQAELSREFRRVTQKLPVVRLKLLDAEGRTVYSTQSRQVGEDRGSTAAFVQARDGRLVSELIYRERFHGIDGELSDRHLLVSHLPLQAADGSHVIGVLELYGDVTTEYTRAQAAASRDAAVIGGVIGALYLTMLALVHLADRSIRANAAHRDQLLRTLSAGRETLERIVREKTVALDDSTGQLDREVAERARIEAKVHQLRNQDPLTGLPNRHRISELAARAIEAAGAASGRLVVVFLDIDHFGKVNSSLGHDAGDQLLQQVASRLRRALPAEAPLARMSSDEFVLVAPLADDDSARDLADRVLAEIDDAVTIDGRAIQVQASAGASVFPADAEGFDDLLRNAATALARAKAAGGNRSEVFAAQMNTDARHKLEIEADLRLALARNELALMFQPKIDLKEQRIAGVEALVRWNHPQRGVISPAEFVPVAEESGQIVRIGEWVLREALGQLRSWHAMGFSDLSMSINASTRQLQSDTFADIVLAAIAQEQVEPATVTIEITESAIFQDEALALRIIGRLRAVGVRVSLDDFGTGCSSLSHLRTFPIDEVKIDRSFVRNVIVDEQDAAIARAIADMANGMNLRVVAEGIEQPSEGRFFHDIGCDEAQGYLYARPLPADGVTAMLRRSLGGDGLGSARAVGAVEVA